MGSLETYSILSRGSVNNRVMLISAAGAFLASASVLWCIRDYQKYLALGPGGPPYNIKGWAWITFAVRPFALKASDTTMVSDYPEDGHHIDIKKLPHRHGPRAELGGIAPHRQLSQHAPEHMRQVRVTQGLLIPKSHLRSE